MLLLIKEILGQKVKMGAKKKNTVLHSDDDDDSDSDKDERMSTSYHQNFSSESILVRISPEDRDGQFFLNLQNGYSFRTLIQFLREIICYGNIYFTPKGIFASEYDKEKKVLVRFHINTGDVIKYFYHCPNKMFKVGISFSSFWNEVRSLGKSDNLIIYKKAGSDQICLRFGPSANRFAEIKMQGVKENDATPPDINLNESPNFIVNLKELSKGAGNIRSGKGKFYISAYPTHLSLENKSDNGSEPRSQKLGKTYDDFTSYLGIELKDIIQSVVDGKAYSSIQYNYPRLIEEYLDKCKERQDPDTEAAPTTISAGDQTSSVDTDTKNSDDAVVHIHSSSSKKINIKEDLQTLIFKTSIDVPLLKGLSKLSNLNEGGTVKVFVKEKVPIILCSNIGCFGKIEIFIR